MSVRLTRRVCNPLSRSTEKCGKNENQKGDRSSIKNKIFESLLAPSKNIRISVTLCPHCGQPMNTRNLAAKYFKEEGVKKRCSKGY